MEMPTTRVLLFEDEDHDAEVVLRFLASKGPGAFKVQRAESVSAGIAILESKAIDIIMLDLRLGDSDEAETFTAVHRRARKTPIVVVTGMSNEEMGPRLVRQGAQDFLVKGKFDSTALFRSLTYAIERQGLMNELENARAIADQDKEARILARISRFQG